jgi:hypothetical protein
MEREHSTSMLARGDGGRRGVGQGATDDRDDVIDPVGAHRLTHEGEA